MSSSCLMEERMEGGHGGGDMEMYTDRMLCFAVGSGCDKSKNRLRDMIIRAVSVRSELELS